MKKDSSVNVKNLFTPKIVIVWLIITSLVVTWDAGFVLLRPRSMEGSYYFV